MGGSGNAASVMAHPDFETLGDADIRRFQEGAWTRQWDYLREASLLYREKLRPLATGR